ncbi:MAG: hypothetical protein AAF204_00270 [Pseudomonadota bacterium]
MGNVAELTSREPFRKATRVNSLWHGNKIGYVLFNGQNPAGRVEVPQSTGDKAQDEALRVELERRLQAWENDGIVPDPVIKLKDALAAAP